MSRQLFECLEALGAVAETGSLTRAAETLGISVSQASRRIKNLSDEWGMVLLARTGTATTLTPEAARLLEEVAPVMRAFDNLERRFRRTRADEISVEAPSAVASVVLAPLAGRLFRIGPATATSCDGSPQPYPRRGTRFFDRSSARAAS